MAKSRRATMRFATLFLVLTSVLSSCAAAAVAAASKVTELGCTDTEREALLAFKAGIVSDPDYRLSSWSIRSGDCCSWSGVVCSNSTGTTSAHVHVVELNVHGGGFSAEKLSPALLSLTQLELLNIGCNDFGGIKIPEFLGSFQKLKHLDLADANFSGAIPPQIGNLTSLTYLSLGFWISGLTEKFEPITDVTDARPYGEIRADNLGWLLGLSSLTYLRMSGVDLSKATHSWLPIINKLPSLRELYLIYCRLASLPSSFSSLNLTALTDLDLNYNGFNSTLPTWLWQLSSLSSLSLSGSQFYGTIPSAIGNLTRLSVLLLNHNLLSGPLPTEISKMTQLERLDVQSNSALGGSLPRGIGNLTSLIHLDINNCSLTGLIPPWPPQLEVLDLSNNFFSGPFPLTLETLQISILILSYNHIEGSIPSSICSSKYIELVDLSNNKMDGKIPTQCWHVARDLRFIDLENNKLTGRIPTSIGSLINLAYLYLNKNNLHGDLPSQLQNCSSLKLIDFGENNLSGNIPAWVGISFQSLIVLRLHSNIFSGSIPSELGQLSTLQVIDFANNRLSGPLPYTFGNLSAISSITRASTMGEDYIVSYFEDETINVHILAVIKGREYNLSTQVLKVSKIIDLSNNFLTGIIPIELGSLAGLQTLNLSRNNFTGKIPKTISGMSSLETLDLSFNNLEGEVPQGLAELSSLNHLNLSYNKLSGNIPTGNQLRTLDHASIYIGNEHLCGAVVNKSCLGDQSVIIFADKEGTQFLATDLGALVGFLVGLWSVFIALLFNKNAGRCLLFRVIDELYDKAYVVVKIRMNRFMSS